MTQYDERIHAGGADLVPPQQSGNGHVDPRHVPTSRPMPQDPTHAANPYADQHSAAQTSAAAVAATHGEPEPPGKRDPHTVTLSKGYQVFNDQGGGMREERTFRFRKPSPQDIRECGRPVRMVQIDTGNALEQNDHAIAKLIHRLSAPQIPIASIDTMDLDDYDTCAESVVAFFGKSKE